jgi:hypothetical protein
MIDSRKNNKTLVMQFVSTVNQLRTTQMEAIRNEKNSLSREFEQFEAL